MSQPQFPLPPLLSAATPPLLYPESIPPPPVSLQKRAGLQETATKHNNTKYNKTMKKSFILNLDKATNRRKRVPRVSKRVRDKPAPIVKSPTKTPS